MSEVKLKPCPFCGSKAKLYGSSKITGTGFKHYQIVVCLNDYCSCRTGFCETVTDAIEKWNTRKPIKKLEDYKRLKSEKEQDIYERAYKDGQDKGLSDGRFVGYNKAIDDFIYTLEYDFGTDDEVVIGMYDLRETAKQLKENIEKIC